MKQKFFGLMGLILLNLVFVSASSIPLNEFMSEDVTQINVTISQSSSTIDFYLNTAGYDWDLMDILEFTYGDYEFSVGGVYISGLLNGVNGDVVIEKGSFVPYFESLNIQLGSTTQFVSDNLFTALDINTNSDEINNNISIVNNLLKENPLPEPAPAYSRLVKEGNNYKLTYNQGYGDIPEDWMSNIRDIVNDSAYAVNIIDLVDMILPFAGNYADNLTFLEDLDLNYTVSAIDLNDLEFKDGQHTISATVEKGNESVQKQINIKLDGIENSEISTTSPAGIFTPSMPEVLEVMTQINGLKNGTDVIVKVFYNSVNPNPSNTEKVHRYLDITANISDSEENAIINFKLDKDEVVDKSFVSLYVWESSSWTKLSTKLITGPDTSYYYYEALIPHFSLFLIAEEEAPVTENDDEEENHPGRPPAINEESDLEDNEPINLEGDGDSNEGFFSRITGAVVGLVKSGGGLVLITTLFTVVAALGVIQLRKRSLKK